MTITFYKYQGTGNDFIIIDNRNLIFDRKNKTLIEKLCHRKFGIGADGFMLLQNRTGYDFEMVYYNADGNESSMCGNGGRCIVDFARELKIIKDKAHFIAIDGEHEAHLKGNSVSLKMNDVKNIEIHPDFYFLNTGSSHYVEFVKDIEHVDVFEKGKEIRYNDRFKKEGTNVNFVEIKEDNQLFVRTYERGVENETLSCGTGVTASALAASLKENKSSRNSFNIKTLGGDLTVKFKKNKGDSFSDIWLEGSAILVFKGEVIV